VRGALNLVFDLIEKLRSSQLASPADSIAQLKKDA
jgi:hypothetical protein